MSKLSNFVDNMKTLVEDLTEVDGDTDVFPDSVKLNDDQKSALRSSYPNLNVHGVEYNLTHEMILMSKNCFNNWQYYAGLEYDMKDESIAFYVDGDLIVLDVCNSDSERLTRIFETIQENV